MIAEIRNEIGIIQILGAI